MGEKEKKELDILLLEENPFDAYDFENILIKNHISYLEASSLERLKIIISLCNAKVYILTIESDIPKAIKLLRSTIHNDFSIIIFSNSGNYKDLGFPVVEKIEGLEDLIKAVQNELKKYHKN